MPAACIESPRRSQRPFCGVGEREPAKRAQDTVPGKCAKCAGHQVESETCWTAVDLTTQPRLPETGPQLLLPRRSLRQQGGLESGDLREVFGPAGGYVVVETDGTSDAVPWATARVDRQAADSNGHSSGLHGLAIHGTMDGFQGDPSMRWALVSLFALSFACSHPLPAKKDPGTDGGQGGQVGTGDGVDSLMNEGGASGGIADTAGASAAGGSSGSTTAPGCAENSICFRDGHAVGLFTGWAWADLDEVSTLQSPTCGPEMRPIISRTSCASPINWNKSDALCLSGLIPAIVTMGEAYQWGMAIGVNAREPSDAVGPSLADFRSITFDFSGAPKTNIRAVLRRKGDPGWNTYCLDPVTSGKTYALTKFSPKCWENSSIEYLTPADLPTIDQIGLEVDAGMVDVRLDDFCFKEVRFGN
jgi:hypothetical protein